MESALWQMRLTITEKLHCIVDATYFVSVQRLKGYISMIDKRKTLRVQYFLVMSTTIENRMLISSWQSYCDIEPFELKLE